MPTFRTSQAHYLERDGGMCLPQQLTQQLSNPLARQYDLDNGRSRAMD